MIGLHKKITNNKDNMTYIKEYLKFEKSILNNPKTFFPMFEAGLGGRRAIIWKEYLDWQQNGGKAEEIEFRDIGENRFSWQMGNEYFAQEIDKFAPFTKEEYQKSLSSVYSFMNDRPQYFKFRKLDGMFNPLRILLFEML